MTYFKSTSHNTEGDDMETFNCNYVTTVNFLIYHQVLQYNLFNY